MPQNDPNDFGWGDSPRLKVLVNGAPIDLALSAEVTTDNHFHAGKFTVTFATADDGSGSDPWWFGQTDAQVDIRFGVLAGGAADPAYVSQMIGRIDKFQIHPLKGTVRIEGRDMTGLLIDNKTAITDLNQFSSDIVTQIATLRGLTPNVTATTTLVQRFYLGDHTLARIHRHDKLPTDWDVVCALAKLEGFDAWVSGTTLNFGPPVDPGADPYILRLATDSDGNVTGNVDDLEIDRTLTLSKTIRVTVESWHARMGKRVKGQATATKKSSSSAHKKPHAQTAVTTTASEGASVKAASTEYVFVRPNLTQAQADALALAYLKDLSKHEIKITAHMPGDNVLTTRMPIQLQGTGTGADQVFYVKTLHRSLGWDQGYRMTVTATNQSIDTEMTSDAETVTPGAGSGLQSPGAGLSPKAVYVPPQPYQDAGTTVTTGGTA